MSTVCESEKFRNSTAPEAVEASASAASAIAFDRTWLVCLVAPALLALWFAFDHSWPFWDAADHVQVEFRYAELFDHARPLKLSWWHDLLTVNYCYPATIHIFNGLLKAVFGAGRWVDGASLVFFSLVLNFSAFAIGRMLLRSVPAACIALLVLNSYPVVSHLSHLKLLDYPHLAMFAAAMFTMLFWRQRPSWPRAVACGLVLGLACTTKQIASFFLVAPSLFFLWEKVRDRNYKEAMQMAFAGLCVVAFLLLWFGFNWHEISAYMSRNSGLTGKRTIATAFGPNFFGYINCFTGMMGYPLLFLSLIGFAGCTRQRLLALFPVILAALVGFVLMAALPFQLPEHRYIVPVLLATALVSGLAAAWVLEGGGKRWLGAVACALTLAGTVQFAVVNYSPYPIPCPQWLVRFCLGVDSERRGALEPSYCPTPSSDPYGQEWIVDTCDRAGGGRGTWLNMLPSTPEVSVHTLEVVAMYRGSHLRPTTVRLWTPVGDRVVLDESSFRNFDFYLIKTGAQGLQFDSPDSEASYHQIENRLRQGGGYSLLGERKLADGSIMSLFKRID